MYAHIDVYINTYVHTKLKEAMNLRGVHGRCWREEREGGIIYFYFNLKNLKKKDFVLMHI